MVRQVQWRGWRCGSRCHVDRCSSTGVQMSHSMYIVLLLGDLKQRNPIDLSTPEFQFEPPECPRTPSVAYQAVTNIDRGRSKYCR